MKVPCEVMASKVIPRIRGELARELVARGHSKKEVAEILGVTIAAISQYTSRKRGDTSDEEIKKIVREIVDDFEAGRISKDDLNVKLCFVCSTVGRQSSE